MSPYGLVPPHGGARIRIWRQLRWLSRHHQVTLVAMGEHGPESLSILNPLCQAVHLLPLARPGQLPANLPGAVGTYCSPAARELLPRLAQQSWDAAVFHFIYTAWWSQFFTCPCVLEEHNIESQLFRQLASRQTESVRWRAQALQLEAFENQWWPRFPLRFAVSPSDQAVMQRRCPSGRTCLAPNGSPVEEPMRERLSKDRILFCGLLNYGPNLDGVGWLLNEIMPLVWRRRPTARVLVAGAHAPLGLTKDERVEVLANPDDMAAVAQTCAVLAVPLRMGGGTRLKILDAMAWGLPIVSTGLGCQDLPVEPGRHLLVAEGAESFALALVKLLEEPQLAEQLRLQARRRAEEKCAWEAVWTAYELELAGLVGK